MVIEKCYTAFSLFWLRNLLQDEGGHLKIGEYWVQKLYERIHPNEDSGIINTTSIDTKKDIRSFGIIFYQVLCRFPVTTQP